MNDIKKWLWEAVKTVYRYAVIALAPIAIEATFLLINTLTNSLVDVKLSENEKWIIRLALAGLDTLAHQWKKSIGEEGRWKGIVGA